MRPKTKTQGNVKNNEAVGSFSTMLFHCGDSVKDEKLRMIEYQQYLKFDSPTRLDAYNEPCLIFDIQLHYDRKNVNHITDL